MQGRAVIVCHAGEGLGLGHLSRCLVTARALKQELGWTCTLLIQGSPVVKAGLESFGHVFVAADADLLVACTQHLNLVNSHASPGRCALVLDLHPRLVPSGLANFLSEQNESVLRIAVDGLFSLHQHLDCLLVPSFQISASVRRLLEDCSPEKLLFGWDCLLVDSEPRQDTWSPGNDVLVLTGGADATQLGNHWPVLLDQHLNSSTSLHWVQGPYAKEPKFDEVAHPHRFQLHKAPASLAPLIKRAHYAVTIYGVTFFELLRAGVPTVVFSPYGTKDDAELREISKLGLALVARDEVHATMELVRLIKDPALAAKLSQASTAQLLQASPKRLIQAVSQQVAA